MKYYIKQHVFTLIDKFSIFDESGNECYYVEGEFIPFGKNLHLYSSDGSEKAFIEKKLFSFWPTYRIYRNGSEIAEIVKEIAFFRNSYSINGLDWTVDGDFMDHDYTVQDTYGNIATVSKQWFTFGDAYEIDVASGVDPSLVISVVLVIDACLDAEKN